MIAKGFVFGKARSNTGDSHAESALFMGEFTRRGWNDWNYFWSHEFNVADLTNSMLVYINVFNVVYDIEVEGEAEKHPQILV